MKKPICVIAALVLLIFFGGQPSFSYEFKIENLTAALAGDSRYPSLNNYGSVAWQTFTDGNNIDVYVDGVNITPETYNESNGIPSLNDSGNVAWQRWFSTNYQVVLDHDIVAGGSYYHAGRPQLNNQGQLAWMQWTGVDWDVFFEGSNLTQALPGAARFLSLNDNGDVAWTHYYNNSYTLYLNGVPQFVTPYELGEVSINNYGQIAWTQSSGVQNEYDVYLDGVNLTPQAGGHASAVSLNDLGQVAWWGFDGSNYDIFLDGFNLTSEFSYLAFSPSLNNRGQIAWSMGEDIYLATPVPEPSTLILLMSGIVGFILLKRFRP